MSHILIKKWDELRSEIEQRQERLNIESLVCLLLDWSKKVKDLKDKQANELYKRQLQIYEDIEIEKILFVGNDLWYSLEEIINDYLLSKETIYKRPVEVVAAVLHELLAFKSDKECMSCQHDNLRVYQDGETEDLYFECDLCLTTYEVNGQKIKSSENKWRFADKKLIISNGLKPYKHGD